MINPVHTLLKSKLRSLSKPPEYIDHWGFLRHIESKPVNPPKGLDKIKKRDKL